MPDEQSTELVAKIVIANARCNQVGADQKARTAAVQPYSSRL